MDVEREVKHTIISICLALFIAIFGYTLIQSATSFHEFFHGILLTLIGCKPVSGAQIFSGATSWENCELTDLQWQVIALAGPLGSFFLGLFLWYKGGENSILRFVALSLMLYSTLPSLYPDLPNSDMWVAIQHGFNKGVGYLLWILASGISFHAILDEILDREILKNLRI